MLVDLLQSLRAFLTEIVLSYKALFTWLDPKNYTVMKFLAPLLEMTFFSFLGKFAAGEEGMRYAAFGNAIMAMGVNTVMGVVTAVGVERRFGTLSSLFLTPANRLRVFIGRAVFHIIDGLFGVIIGLTYATLFFGINFGAANLGALVFIIVFTSIVSVGYGLLLGGYSLFSRDVGMVMNTAFFILLLLCGVNFPVTELPIWLQPLSYVIPLTYGIMAARQALQGYSLDKVGVLLFWEAITGAAMLGIGYTLFRWFERLSKQKGTLDVV